MKIVDRRNTEKRVRIYPFLDQTSSVRGMAALYFIDVYPDIDSEHNQSIVSNPGEGPMYIGEVESLRDALSAAIQIAQTGEQPGSEDPASVLDGADDEAGSHAHDH